jgi:hypothetical protein
MTTGSARYICVGQANSSKNQGEIAFVYNGASSNTNAMTFGLFGGERMRITGGGPILINRTTYANVNNKLEVNGKCYFNDQVGIGNSDPWYPLHVSIKTVGDASYNYYYYLGPGSSNGSTTTTPSDVSIRSEGRILVNGEVDVISDIRTKTNINPLDKDYCINFIKNVNPKTFSYKKNPNGLEFGYIAQDLMKNGFGELVMVSTADELDEYIDEDGFISEKDKLYTLSRSQNHTYPTSGNSGLVCKDRAITKYY